MFLYLPMCFIFFNIFQYLPTYFNMFQYESLSHSCKLCKSCCLADATIHRYESGSHRLPPCALIFGMCYNQPMDNVILPQQLEQLIFQLGFNGRSCRARTFRSPFKQASLHAGGRFRLMLPFCQAPWLAFRRSL